MINISSKIKDFVSPSRRYVIIYKDKYTDKEYLFDLKNLSELYINDVNGALSYFKQRGSSDLVISCVPYEVHLERIREQEENYNHILVSPTRKYAVYVEDPLFPTMERIYMIILPPDYANDEIEAVNYLFKKIDPEAKVTNCLTYEMFLTQNANLKIDPYRFIYVGKQKENPERRNAWPESDYIKHLEQKNKILAEIKMSLAKFYEEDSNNISDSEVLYMIEKLEQDYSRYASVLKKITDVTRNLTFRDTKHSDI